MRLTWCSSWMNSKCARFAALILLLPLLVRVMLEYFAFFAGAAVSVSGFLRRPSNFSSAIPYHQRTNLVLPVNQQSKGKPAVARQRWPESPQAMKVYDTMHE